MPLAYYSRAATAEFWSEHWGRHSVEELVGVARWSPLTDLILSALPADGVMLEGGCGLGQYVVLLRDRGYHAVGADWSLEALRECRRFSKDAALAVMDLRQLAVRSGSLSAYVSLGVVEHDPAGPDGIVAEAARVLRPGGILLLSAPYLNGIRRLFAPYLVLRNRRLRDAGGQFYQFAFKRREVGAFLEAHGLAIRSFHPHDPARMIRKAIKRVIGRGGREEGVAPCECGDGGPAQRSVPLAAALRRAVRRLLYTAPLVRLFGHMILAVAVRR